jgi:pilus assembly protein FimV
MPPDAGMDVDADVDMLLAETREEAEPTLEDLQATVRQLEGRVEELERRLREEIAQLVPAEAAKIIREEIAALAAELDD